MCAMMVKSKWHLNDLDVATVEELHPEGAMEVQNLRALGMGWAWYVNDLSKYLPDAETLADMTPAEGHVSRNGSRSSSERDRPGTRV